METSSTISNIWQRSKTLVKGLIISVLVLLLLIPAYFVQNLVEEREERQKEAVTEVSDKWASAQIITGPIVVLPYWQNNFDTTKFNTRIKQFAYFLPNNLEINSSITPIKKHRGIYSVMLYNSVTNLAGNFRDISPALLKIDEADIIWNEAFIKVHISDPRGLNNELTFKWKDTSLVLSPLSVDDGESARSLGALLPIASLADLKDCSFTASINLKGSEKILFSPVGKMTSVNLESTWSHPSFTGNSLPDTSSVNEKGFRASWKSLSHTRPYPQQWKNNIYTIGNYFPDPHRDVVMDTSSSLVTASAFGADLFVPVNGYQKTMRSVKYAVLCILLTFTAFFLIETANKKSVHPLHYALIGFALILFYTLLLSISEYTGFNIAYGIAAVSTIGLIAWFVRGLLGSIKLSLLLSAVLLLLYSYVFTILQLQDYALLLGSVGLFLTLAVVMRFSKKIQW